RQLAALSAAVRKFPHTHDCVVGPGGVHTFRNFNTLGCPTGTNRPSENKSQSRRLSNPKRVGAAWSAAPFCFPEHRQANGKTTDAPPTSPGSRNCASRA